MLFSLYFHNRSLLKLVSSSCADINQFVIIILGPSCILAGRLLFLGSIEKNTICFLGYSGKNVFII